MKKNLILWMLLIGGMLGCTDPQPDYLTIHNNALVADLHSDTPMKMRRGFDFAARDTSGHMDLPRLQEGGVDLQVLACFVSTGTPAEECRPRIDEMIDSITAQVSRNEDDIEICLSAADAERIVGEGKIAAFIGIENGVAVNNNLENLQHYYDRGVRLLDLTHTASSDWCISSADTNPAFHGLTDFGREVVRKMNQMGMIIDVSHAHVTAVEEVLKITTDPVIASHSCVHAICPHDRNLTDDQIKAIAQNGGMIGINFYGGYLSPGGKWNVISDSIWEAHGDEIDSIRALYKEDRDKRYEAMQPIFDELRQQLASLNINVATVVDHMDHIVKLVGPDHVGLGSDFDGVFGLPQGLSDCSMVPNITRELVARGYSQTDIEKILGGNFMRIFRQVCDN
jgi:membrane dipeptidase